MYLNGTKSCSLFLGCLLSLSAMAKDARPVGMDVAKITTGQGLQKPLSFIENKGQVVDEKNNPRFDVQYKLSTAGMNLYLGSGMLTYQFFKTVGNKPENMQVTTYKMGVTLVGANPNARVVAGDEQAYYENYYRSQNDAGFTVHSFNKVTYKDVYPNIDWVLYIKDNNVEYDFVVHAGGDASQIKLAYDGAAKLSIAADGSIVAETPMGTVKERKLYAYETSSRKEVAANFKVSKNTVSFETGNYRGDLTIDPYLLWSTYFGGTNEDVCTSVAETAAGIAYVGGFTASTNIAVKGAGFKTTNPGGTYDAFLTAYTVTGTRTFTTYFGATTLITEGTGVALDNTGAIYLAGYSNGSATGLTSTGAYHTVNEGGYDGFLIKFTNTGARTWCTFYGGTANDYIYGVACDAGNNVYITGQTASTALIATTGAYQTTLNGTSDAFVAKFNAAGTIQWSTYYGGTAQEQGLAIACDASSNVIVGGQTNSVVDIATTGAFQTALDGTQDGFLAQFTTAGVLNWGTYYGGEGIQQINGVACNPTTKSIAVVGVTNSLTHIASYKAYQGSYGGGTQDGFVAYFTTTGAEAWSSYYGGTATDYGQAVCFDAYQNIAIAGGTFSNNGIATTGAYQTAIAGDYDAYVAKFNTLGQIIWGTYFGGNYYDYANGIACASTNDELVIAGYTASTTGIASGTVDQAAFGGGTYDGFVTQFKKDTLVAINQPYIDTILCAGSSFNVAYTVNSNFLAANTFKVQLSNATGSFATPVTIGTITSNTSGTILCTIPAGTATGTGYRIRIVTSAPIFTSPDDYLNIDIINELPQTTASGSTPVCVGADIYLYDTAAYQITSYKWIGPVGSGAGGTGFSATTQNAINTGFSGAGATLADGGTYSIVTTHNGCPNDTSTVAIVVNSFIPPTPADSATATACAGSSLYLFANSDTTAAVTYKWSGPNGFTSTLQDPVISSATTLNSGTYYVMDTLDGCPSAKNSISITVNSVTPVSVHVSANPGDTVCSGTTVTFTATTTTGGVSPSYQWMTGSTPVVGAVTSTWATPSLTTGETVYCIMSSDVVCPSPINATSNVLTMDIVDGPPLVNIGATPGAIVAWGTTVIFTAYTYNAGSPTYQWSVNGVPVSGATLSTYVLPGVTETDTVSVRVTSDLSCALPDYATNSLVVSNPNTGVSNVSSALENIDLYPNPNAGNFTIKGALGSSNISKVGFTVYNLLGQAVYANSITPASNMLDKTFELNNLPDGVYMMNINGDGGESKIIRFTVQH